MPNKKTARQRRLEEERRKELRAKRITWILAILGVALGVPGLLVLFPRITISSVDSVRQSEAMGTVFSITNGGLLDLEDAQIFCGIVHVSGSRLDVTGGTFHMPDSDVGTIPAGDSRSAPCEQVATGDMEGEIIVHVSYRPALWPWRREKKFFMKSKKTDRGTFIWRQTKETNETAQAFPK